jgi:N-acyl-D-aspartate/D-glutamate deacylase
MTHTETMKEILDQAHKLAHADDLKSLVEDLQEFLKIQEKRSQDPENKSLTDSWMKARNKVWENFDKVATHYDITPAMIREQLKSSNVFSGEYKDVYEKIKQENLRK